MDFYAILSTGTYPFPTPPLTASQRAKCEVSYGLLSIAASLRYRRFSGTLRMVIRM